MIETLKQFSLGLSLLLVSLSSAHGSEAALRSFFSDVTSLSADFVQRVEDESGSTLERSSGKFYLQRPGKFRWDYRVPSLYAPDALSIDVVKLDADQSEPYTEPGQQIVADGKDLYFYDPDLEQVSKRSLADALGQVPSLLIAQSGADIDQHFSINDFGLTDGLSWVSLKPKSEDAGYQQLMIAFDDATIRSLLLYDGLGNTTRLELNKVNVGAEIEPEKFKFVVPDGVDLLGE